jgi:hypothetical protein
LAEIHDDAGSRDSSGYNAKIIKEFRANQGCVTGLVVMCMQG